MKVSYNYLKSHLDLTGLTPEAVAEKLTFAGAEVEGISYLSEATGLVVGKILSCLPHPDSDHLHILQVDEGEKYGVEQIVCGAPNARTGLKVIVARPGARLPEIEIKPSLIRGVESNGMCCALYELGVDRKYLSDYQCAGIEELPDDFEVGDEDPLGKLGYGDAILDMDLLPNRPDLYALNNVVREVACLFNLEPTIEEGVELGEERTDFLVTSSSPSCPSFQAIVAKGVKTKESPLWLKSVLMASGIRPINNIVDIGNYVMLVTGQPLNMYDEDKLPERKLDVVDDYEGKFLAMDGKEYDLLKGDLLVSSQGKGMCLAGIMTADCCRVDESTVNIVVEAASFAGASIRRTSSRLGLSSDSSLRFVKGVNPLAQQQALRLVKKLLLELAETADIEVASAYGEAKSPAKEITVSLSYLNARLGTEFREEQVLDALTRDGFTLMGKSAGEFHLLSPSYRLDIDGKADVSEEVIRLLGLDNVKSELPVSSLSLTGLTERQKKERLVRRLLNFRGLDEVLTYTLVSQDKLRYFPLFLDHKPYELANPLTSDHAYVRTSIAYSLLEVLSYNAARQAKDGAIFEVADVDAEGYEATHLALAYAGEAKQWGDITRRSYDFYDAKGALEEIFRSLGVIPSRYRYLKAEDCPSLHPGRSAYVCLGKQRIGFLGEVHPSLLKRLGLNSAVVMEIDLSAVFDLKVSPIKSLPPSRFPFVTRDLSFVVDDKVGFDEVKKTVMNSSLIKEVTPFDVYVGPHLPSGKKSLAISIKFAADKTLVDEEVNNAMAKVIADLEAKLAAEVRK